MNGAEDMIVDHNMVVTQVFRRLGKRLDRPCIAAKFDLRINHTSFHRRLPLSRCEVLRQIQTIGARSGSSSPNTGAYFRRDTVADYPARDDDRELQMEQTIVGLPVRKLQPPAWCATAARSVLGASRWLPDRLGEGPLTEPTADSGLSVGTGQNAPFP